MARTVFDGFRLALALVFISLLVLLPPSVARAEGLRSGPDRRDIPEDLVPWIPWALSGSETQLCPTVQGTPTCAWPSTLRVDADADRGRFELVVHADAPTSQVIPGGEGIWPLRVSIDNVPAAVLKGNGLPILHLTSGHHVVRGEFEWSEMPDTIPIAPDTALVRIFLAGSEVPLVKRDENKLWLQRGSGAVAGNAERDSLTLSVFRRISDGVLMTIESRLIFEVSGRAREVSLSNPLLPSSFPLRVSGDLALRLEPNGDLRVQLVPGKHEIALVARPLSPDGPLSSPARPSPWPAEETWTFAPAPSLRSVELRGLAGIDASRTDLPAEWKNLGAYLVHPGDELSLVNTRRGQEQMPENQLRLDRTFWLDEAGGAFTVLDRLSGEMHQSWRLNLDSGELGSVRLGAQRQVVTVEPGGVRGVELRESQVDLTAVSRVKRSPTLKAVGWSEDVRSLSAHVLLPPGWNIIAALGVDNPSGTWVDRWDLFDFFYVLIVSLALFRLLGKGAGVTALCALVLMRGEMDAPEYFWLPLVALGALARFLPAGFWQRFSRGGFFLVALSLTIALVTFSVGQIRGAIYPHLSRETQAFSAAGWQAPMLQAEPPTDGALEESKEGGMGVGNAAPETPAADVEEPSRARKMKSSVARAERSISSEQLQYKPDAITQSGPGVPESLGEVWHLEWTGPVVKDHEMRLVLLSPSAHRLATVFRLLSLFALAFLVFRHFWPFMKLPFRASSSAASVALGLSLFVGLSGAARSAQAEEPSDARLLELKTRLLAPAPCEPNCLSVSAVRIQLGRELELEAEVHAGARLAYRLPGPASSFASLRTFLDGRAEVPSRRGTDGALYVRLEPGVHKVRLAAGLSSERFTLDLGTPPERVTVDADGWLVSGLSEIGQAPSGALTLQKEARPEELGLKTQSTTDNIPPFFVVHRTLDLAVTPGVSTAVQRMSDPAAPEQMHLALLPGEHVITPGLGSDKQGVIVGFPAETTERAFHSSLNLPAADGSSFTLTLSAPENQPYLEVWTIRCGVIYHCSTEGVVPSSYLEDGRFVLTFHPRMGESLKVHVQAPEPAKGEYLTVQSAHMKTAPGVRSSETTLDLELEVSRSMVHGIHIPKHSRIERVTVNGAPQAVKLVEGELNVSLEPGTQKVQIVWQEPVGISSAFRAPDVDLGASGVNFRTSIEMPHDRWLLWVGGPAQGPALLYWGYLFLIVLAAWFLSRLPYAPLGFGKWLLLGLGLTQVPASVAVLTAGWFFVIGSRRIWPSMVRWLHNLVHLGIIFYSLSFLSGLFTIVYAGLVGSPDMEVTGAGSYAGHLSWYVDRSSGRFGSAHAFSVSLWVWRGVMLAWSFWLATSLLGWLKWAFAELREGEFWKARTKTLSPEPTQPAFGEGELDAPERPASSEEPPSSPA